MSTIIEMSKALRKATGNADASDEFLQALEERETQREERFDRMHQQAMRAIQKELGLMHRENKFMMAMLGIGFPILGLLVLLTH